MLKKSLPRALVSLSLMVSLLSPAWAQQAYSISQLKEQIKNLLLVENNPNTPAEVRNLNRTFLAERRAELRALIQKRLVALRKYRTDAQTNLSEGDLRVLDNSIAELESDLQSLGETVKQPAATSRAAASHAARARRSSDVQPATPNAQGAQVAASAATAQPAVEESSHAANSDTASPTAAPSPIVITAPDKDMEVHTKQYEVKITVNEPLDDLLVSIYNPPTATKPLTRHVEMRPSDQGKKSIVVELDKGDNKIEVSAATDASKKDTKTLKYTPVSDVLGAKPAASSSTPESGTMLDSDETVSSTLTSPTLNQPKDGDTSITGSVTTTDATATVEVWMDPGDAEQRKLGEVGVLGDNSFRYSNPRLILRSGEVISVRLKVNDEVSRPTEKPVIIEGADRNPLEGAPTGVIFGGAVISQQAQEFQQSDPFFGFVAGYRFPAWVRMTNAVKVESDGSYAVYKKDSNGNYTIKDHACLKPNDPRVRHREDACPMAPFGGARLHLRFQGIFTASPRAAQVSATASPTPTPMPGTTNPLDFQPFVTSRKTFDTELHMWYDMPVSRNYDFFIGPYAAWGASTILSKNELNGEKIGVPDKTGNTTAVDGSQVQTDNDIKQYKELGLHMNTRLFNGKVFIESIVARGWYESMQGLYAGHDTRKRFIGKLRIFPSGLSTTFGEQIKMAPMFGVDINAGRGPDQLRFFTGFAVRIKSLEP